MKRMPIKCAQYLAVGFFFCLIMLAQGSAIACTSIKFKADRIALTPPTPGSGAFISVSFNQSYTNPVVFVLPTNQNPDPAAIRVRNVTSTGFQIAVVEPTGSNGPNTGMTVDFLTIEAGSYTLPNGNRLEAGTVNTTQMQSKFIGTGSSTVNFSNTYAAPPVVLVQIQTTANEPGMTPSMPSSPWMTATAFNITANSVQVALERSEDTSGSVTVPETIGYLAIQSGASGTFTDNGANTITYEALRTASTIVGWDNSCANTNFSGIYPPRPIALANKGTRNGADGGWLRRCNLNPTRIGLQVDEDRANDSERSHTTETAGIVLFSQAFSAILGSLRFEADTVVIPPASAGTASFTAVSFSPSFAVTPLVFALPTNQGSAPAALRIRNITTSGFEIAALEPTAESGPHPSMTIDYIAATPGNHTLPDGTIIEAGAITTARYQAGTGGSTGWVTINFGAAFSTPPAVLLQIQSSNSELIDPSLPSVPWLVVAARNISTTSMNVALERAEAIAGTVIAETIGYLAMAGNVQSSFIDADGSGILCEAILTSSNVQGWDNGCFNNNFANTYAFAPLAVAHQATRNGGNGGWLRRCNLTASRLGLTVDEDRASDSERSHITEQAGILAFSQPFETCWEPQIAFSKTVATLWDPINGSSNPKAIPGARMQYIMSAVNAHSGRADTDTVLVSDPLDSNTEMFVGDLTGSGSPIIFTDGSAANYSGLSYSFISLSSTADDIDFSNNNGVTFDYEPSPDTDGFDDNVTNFRVSLKGAFRAADIGVQPTFQIEFHTRVR
jgi:hypothetical protein